MKTRAGDTFGVLKAGLKAVASSLKTPINVKGWVTFRMCWETKDTSPHCPTVA